MQVSFFSDEDYAVYLDKLKLKLKRTDTLKLSKKQPRNNLFPVPESNDEKENPLVTRLSSENHPITRIEATANPGQLNIGHYSVIFGW